MKKQFGDKEITIRQFLKKDYPKEKLDKNF